MAREQAEGTKRIADKVRELRRWIMDRENGKRNRCRHCNVRLRGRRADAWRVSDRELERHPLPWCPIVACWHLYNRAVRAADDPQSAGRLPRGARIRKPTEYAPHMLGMFHDDWVVQMGRRAKQPDAIRCGVKVARLRFAA